MTVKVTGVEQMMAEIRQKVNSASDKDAKKALNKGAELVHRNMQSGMSYFRDTGATLDEMKVSKIQTSRGELKVYVYWEGPRNRYRLIHLNEKGYTRRGKRYTPRGYGAIARTVRRTEAPYYDTIRRELS